MWEKSDKFYKRSQTTDIQNQHSFLSKENKIKVMKEQKMGSQGRQVTAEFSWMRSNYTTGEGGKIDTFSLLEYEDDLSSILKKKVKEKKMQDWDQNDISLFLNEIGMGRCKNVLIRSQVRSHFQRERNCGEIARENHKERLEEDGTEGVRRHHQVEITEELWTTLKKSANSTKPTNTTCWCTKRN